MKSFTLARDGSRSAWLVVLVAAALCWALMALLSLTSPWKQIEFRLLDEMSYRSAANKSMFPITIVGIDEASFADLALQWPWPRSLHADLVDRLAAAGAAVIVFDVVFAEPSNPKDDKAFAESIHKAGNVVLAADRAYRESSSVRQWLRVDPYHVFTDAGAQTGLAQVPLDPDLVIRQIPDSADALWRTTIARLIRDHPEITPDLHIAPGSLIRYAGADHTFPFVSYHEIVKPDGSIPDDFFRDQIVIIGRDIKASTDVESAQADLFASPFTAHTRSLTPGAEVHANILETVLGNKAIGRVPGYADILLVALAALASAAAMRRWRPLNSALAGAAIMLAIAAATWGLFVKWNLWVPAASALAAMPLMYIGLGAWSYLLEQRRRMEITRAFSLYVTPQVVEYLIAHPDRIKLGGETRAVTIMFTDLAGFTSFSEALAPEQVTYILKRHFTAITDIVFQHNGTVAAFIGDAIMALWGAPLEDPEQAGRAVEAAVAMQAAMEALREEFVAQGLPPIRMRIGIHSGPAIVGNMGSEKRFDYTATGDSVNLAARLEGVNKLYGTGILVSGETACQVTGRMPLRLVDKVIVKGKSKAVEVFTPCDNPEAVMLSAEAIEKFRGQDWDNAEAGFRKLLALLPEDRIAELYLERIAGLKTHPPAADWDGAMELEKL